VGGGAAAGAVVGGLIGHGKGAAVGALAGGVGGYLYKKHKDHSYKPYGN
ncbi:MAG: glycine zipper domain-containing protein, partial [Bryobacteraceae bacterium]